MRKHGAQRWESMVGGVGEVKPVMQQVRKREQGRPGVQPLTTSPVLRDWAPMGNGEPLRGHRQGKDFPAKRKSDGQFFS